MYPCSSAECQLKYFHLECLNLTRALKKSCRNVNITLRNLKRKGMECRQIYWRANILPPFHLPLSPDYIWVYATNLVEQVCNILVLGYAENRAGHVM